MLGCWALTLFPSTLRCQQDKLPPVRTSISVVATIEEEAPASITTLDEQQIQESPGINLDDRLRQIPGFSLLRRSSSVAANPTSQGVSLRGIGPTGASRTLVLWDGVPVNDPFGGWVYWTRIAPEELERVEVSRGASTSVFGDRAMGGALGLFSRQPEPLDLSVGYMGGNENSHEAYAGFSHLFSRWAFSGFSRAFRTDGYYIVPDTIRGPVDTQANVEFVAGDAKVDYFGTKDRVFLKLDVLAEDRGNGTVKQINSTSLGTLSGRYQHDFQNDSISVLAFHTREQFHSTFSSVNSDRTFERLTQLQSVPAESVGGNAMWNHNGSRLTALVGGDFLRTEGFSHDTSLTTGVTRILGGDLFQQGYFGQANYTAGPARLFAGVRQNLAGSGRNFFSPSGGVAVGRRRIRARGSVYRSFRVPTLNELYRDFRVGNVITQANPLLVPETLFGAEAGVDFVGENSSARVTFFRNALGNLITNVTLNSTPSLITRQRRNSGDGLSRGGELEARHRWRNLTGELSYLFVDSRYDSGARLPQVPRHQGSGLVAYSWKGTLASVSVRSWSSQFDDDLNQFLLPGYATLQMTVQQRIKGNLSATAAVENILDRQYYVGLTPTPTIGAPLLWRAGLRWSGPLRSPGAGGPKN